jgi:two-component system chemotaxis response regulator CheB
MPTKPQPHARKTPPTVSAKAAFPVIAMAASVGGLKALSAILSVLPADFAAAIAIVMHLSPDHDSVLAEILDRRTPLVVKKASTGDVLCQSCVFVAPPNHHLLVADSGRLELSSSSAEKVHYARPSAEPLFASVAAVYRKNAIAVVLTGGDGDGSFGVQIIKDHGGRVIAQDRPTTEQALREIRGLTDDKCARYGEDILALVRAARPDEPPPAAKPPAVVMRAGKWPRRRSFPSRPALDISQAISTASRRVPGVPAGKEGIYILELAQGRVYVGHSGDVRRRIQQHMAGQGIAVRLS